MWLGVDPKIGAKRDIPLKDIELHAHNYQPDLEIPTWPLNGHENTHSDKEQDTRTSSNNYEANGYMYDLDLLIILHSLHDAYPTTSGCTQREEHPCKARLPQ